MSMAAKRRFNVLDAVILVAFTALGITWCVAMERALARERDSTHARADPTETYAEPRKDSPEIPPLPEPIPDLFDPSLYEPASSVRATFSDAGNEAPSSVRATSGDADKTGQVLAPPPQTSVELDVEQRSVVPGPFSRLSIGGLTVCRWFTFFLTVWVLAFLLIRIRHPRPSFRRLIRSPGTIASLVLIIVLSVQIGIGLMVSAVSILYPPGDTVTGPGLFGIMKEVAATAGPAVLSSWVILGLTRKSRRHGDWVEIFGVLLGLGWILLLLEPVMSAMLVLIEVRNGTL